MARKQRSELAAGIFTILALVLLIGVIFWLGASDILKPGKQEAWFYVNLDQGGQGLQTGSQVKITDVVVGKINDVKLDLDSNRAYYIVKLHDSKARVYSDAEVSVKTALVGGGAIMEILNPGTSGKLAGKGNPVKIRPDDFDKMLAQFDTLAVEIKKLLGTVSGELDKGREGSAMQKIHAMMDVLKESLASIRKELDAGNKIAMVAKLHKTIEYVRDIAADAQPKVKSTLAGIDKMVADANPKVSKLLDGAGELVDEFKKITKKDVADILTKLRQANTDLVAIAGNFAKVSEEAKNIMAVNREAIDEIIDNMLAVSTNLKSASKEIRRSPWRLFYQPKKGELHSQNIHDAARSFSSGAAQLDQALAKLKGLAASHPKGVPSDDPHLKQIAKQIRDTFEKFTEAEKALWKELSK